MNTLNDSRILVSDSSETDSILDFAIWLSLLRARLFAIESDGFIMREQVNFFLLFTRYFFCLNQKLLKCVNQYRLEEKTSKLNLVIR